MMELSGSVMLDIVIVLNIVILSVFVSNFFLFFFCDLLYLACSTLAFN